MKTNFFIDLSFQFEQNVVYLIIIKQQSLKNFQLAVNTLYLIKKTIQYLSASIVSRRKNLQKIARSNGNQDNYGTNIVTENGNFIVQIEEKRKFDVFGESPTAHAF